MAKLGILVCGEHSEEIAKKYEGTYEDFFIRALTRFQADLETTVYRVFDLQFPEHVTDCDSYLITGSKSGVYEPIDWIKQLLVFAKEAHDADRRLAGVCFGHQLIAQALGGHVEKAPQGWGLGYQSYEVLKEFGPFKKPCLNLYAIHQDQVMRCPPDGEVTLRTEHCAIAGLKYGDKAVSFQPHPEFSQEFESDLISSINGEKFSKEQGDAALAGLLGTQVDNDMVMSYLASFLNMQV